MAAVEGSVEKRSQMASRGGRSRSGAVQPSSSHSSTHHHARPQCSDRAVPSDPTHTSDGAGSSIGRKRTRGPTRCVDVIRLRPGQKLVVGFDATNRAIGINARKLGSYCGVIVRNSENCPLKCQDWAVVPQEKKQKMWDLVKEKFEIPDINDRQKVFVDESLCKKFREHRYHLKKNHYDPYTTDQERRRHHPKDISKTDWAWLVHHWGTPQFQDRSKKNKTNRAKQVMLHCSGTKSFARVEDEETRTSGTVPSRMRMFELTHQRRDGSVVDAPSEEVMSQFRSFSTQQEKGVVPLTENEIYRQVMPIERHGRVRGYGMGPNPTTIFGAHSSRDAQATRLAKEAMQKVDQMQMQMTMLQRQMDSMAELIRTMRGEQHPPLPPPPPPPLPPSEHDL